MKAYISTSGDMSVGIPGSNTEVELYVDLTEGDESQREVTREALATCFACVWGEGKVRVVFEDETLEPCD